MAADIIFKGIRDGLMVYLPEIPYADAEKLLLDKMEAHSAFFEGGDCPLYVSGEITDAELDGLRLTLREKFGVREVIRATARAQTEAKRGPAADIAPRGMAGAQSLALTIGGTVRNGQKITYQGDIIVMGDANPGSHLIAGGNVIVLGALRGVAHAGAFGEEGGTICAFTLTPTQLRIAGYIARPPEGLKRPDSPQMAKVAQGRIEIINLTKTVPGGIL